MNYGIVAEFNPFHNGHKYLVDSIKQSENDVVVAVMSGNFVQRGEPAVLDVNKRTKMALDCGVDLVLSLPFPYCSATAERFALSGVTVLDSLNCLHSLAFGSESNNKEMLLNCAKNLRTKEFNSLVSNLVESGVSFPTAREQAVKELFGEKQSELLQKSNDILGVEYAKALLELNSNLDITTVKRTGAEHDSKDGTKNIRSASLIRTVIEDLAEVENFVPNESLNVLKDAIENKKIIDYSKYELSLLFKLRTMSVEELRALPDVNEGLEYRIYDAVRNSTSNNELLEKIKTKRYTLSRIRRILLFAYLGVTKELLETPVPYIRVLGFNEKGALLLKQCKEKAKLPVITRSADLKNLDENGKKIFELECKARDLYSLCLQSPDICGKEMTEKIIIIK
ncbi:MAG: nucleotidyltransferase [Clostridia bacterium]|nr:nucleotidyltransferase [Clostridia bacterium]